MHYVIKLYLQKTGKLQNEMIHSFQSFMKVAYTLFLSKKYIRNRFLNLYMFSDLRIKKHIVIKCLLGLSPWRGTLATKGI